MIVAVVSAFILLRIPFLDREYAPEEPLWVTAAEGVAKTGYPLANLGETKIDLPAYWKPPLFPLTLGLFYKLFGAGETVSRSMPFVFGIGQLIIILLLCRRIFGKERGQKIGLLACFILAISPFAIQNNTYIETDGGILPFFVLILIYNVWPILSDQKTDASQWFFVFASAFLTFGSRFETSILLFGALAFTALLRGGVWKALKIGAVFALSILLFFIVYHAYNSYFGHPETTLRSIEMITASLRARSAPTATAESPLNVFTYLGDVDFGFLKDMAIVLFPVAAFSASVTIWLTVPLALIIIFSFFSALKSARQKITENAAFLIPAAVIIAPFALTGTGANWPRHIYTAFVLAVILASKMLWDKHHEDGGFDMTAKRYALAGALLSAGIVLSPWNKILFLDRVRSGAFWMGAALVITTLLAVAIFLCFKSKARILAFLVPAFVVFSGAIWLHDVSAPYTLTAYYGNYGYKDAAAFLRSHIADGERLLTLDTIGYYFGGAYYDITHLVALEKVPNPDWIAVYGTPPGRFDAITRGKTQEAAFGTVKIFHSPKGN